MKVNKTEIIESIKKLNKEKPLMEGAEIQRATLPADADALEQHQEALKQNAERRDPNNYDKQVKELIQETASEESRYRHFDVVDRKDLAKKINEAKEKGLDFKVCKSNKEGFRYDLKVLKEDFMKKDAGNPDVNTAAFNKSTNVSASSPTTDLGEDFTSSITPEGERLDYDVALNWIKYILKSHSFKNIIEALDYMKDVAEEYNLTEDTLDENYGDEELDEELKIFTSNLDNFHPSERCKDFWNEIKEAHKEEDLDYALETLYPDGISDTALDDMLCHEEDWVRDLIDLPLHDDEDEVKDEPEVSDEFDDEDVEPLEGEDEKLTDKTKDKVLDLADEKVDEKVEEKTEEPEKVKEEETVVITEPTEDEVDALAEGFLKNNFKPNTLDEKTLTKDVVKQAVTESAEDEEVVAVDDELVENMLGLPKIENSKKEN